MEQYDYIIIGGGCAGLSLAFHMKKNGLFGKKILILEEKRKKKNDRSWCFWAAEAPKFGELLVKSWDKLAFRKGDFEQVESPQKLKYHYIKGSDFYEEMHRMIQQDPMFEYRQERVVDIETVAGGVKVKTRDQLYHASWAFNSIPPHSSQKKKEEIWLQQHFVGYFLETEKAVFDKEEVSFMDFRTAYPNAFIYILPFSSTHALVEFTAFSEKLWEEKVYDAEIRSYLKDKMGIERFEIKEIERGAIPMSSHRFSKKESDRIINIGTRGGMTKPTTGYTFLRIQEDSKKIVDQLIRSGNPLYVSDQKIRYRFYDNLLLDIIKHEPEQVDRIMGVLFKRNKISTILRFLSEKTSPWNELRLLLRLPWAPFFRAIYRYYLNGKITPSYQSRRRSAQSSYPIAQPGGISPLE